MRQSARWALIGVAVAIMVLVLALPFGLRGAEHAGAVAPDVYQVTAGSSVIDTDSFQTGVISPSPFLNTAFPLTSVTSNNQPLSEAHAAFLEHGPHPCSDPATFKPGCCDFQACASEEARNVVALAPSGLGNEIRIDLDRVRRKQPLPKGQVH